MMHMISYSKVNSDHTFQDFVNKLWKNDIKEFESTNPETSNC